MQGLEIEGGRIEYRWVGVAGPSAPVLVFLHEGLGSAGLWRKFPDRVAEATRCTALVYSRLGHGGSTAPRAPNGVGFMHEEATRRLPALLDRLEIRSCIFVGHSDGASIALIHAASADPGGRVRAVVAEAPHVFVEDVTTARIAERAREFAAGDLRERLAAHHRDVDAAFHGWADVWLDPAFKRWDLRAEVERVAVPILVIQGEDDDYGSWSQVEAIAARAPRVETICLPDCRHAPHRDQPDATLAAMTRFIVELVRSPDRRR